MKLLDKLRAPADVSDLCWSLLCALITIALLLAIDNRRQLRQVPTLRRGCVQVEFSADGKQWGATDNPEHPLPILRLHNTCSGTAVRLDEPEDRE